MTRIYGHINAGSFRAALIVGALIAALSGCEKAGPAEQAGKQIDRAVEKAGKQIEKAGDAIQDAAKGERK